MQSEEVHDFDPRLRSPFSMLVIGSSQAGKTTMVLDLIERRAEVIDTPIDKVIYVYSEFQEKFKRFMEKNPDVLFTTDYSDIDKYTDEGKKCLIVFDDKFVDLQKKDNSYITHWFVAGSHHKGCCVIVLLQQLFAKNLRAVSLNAKYLALYPSPRDSQQYYVLGRYLNILNFCAFNYFIPIFFLGRQMLPKNSLFLINCLEDATKKQYRYLFIDLSTDTDNRFRFRNSIFPSDDLVIYVPKQ